MQNNNNTNSPIVPCKLYLNPDKDKIQILKDNKKRSGVYIWQNLSNDKKYVGSSVDLTRRFYVYFNARSLVKDSSMPICCALLLYGYSSFSLGVLEYCAPSEILEREKYYFKLLKSITYVLNLVLQCWVKTTPKKLKLNSVIEDIKKPRLWCQPIEKYLR